MFEEIETLYYFIIYHPKYFWWFLYICAIIGVTRDNIKTKKFIDALFWGLIIGSFWILSLLAWLSGLDAYMSSQMNFFLRFLCFIVGFIIWVTILNQLTIFEKKFNLTEYLNRKKK